MLFQRLDDWLRWLETLHPSTIDMGLERVTAVFNLLNFDFSNTHIFTVAGTNGKGSCVATLEALLHAHGESVGTYTSPHLLRYNERVRINGCEATDLELCAAFQAVEDVRGEVSLTYFEYGTLAALQLFAKAKVSCMVLEVGLGGRLDAVNIVDPSVAIITSIDIDHQDWLGNNREAIGREKAGIYRREKPALCSDMQPPQSVIDRAEEINAQLILAGKDFYWQHDSDGHWFWQGHNKHDEEHRIRLPATPLPKPSIAAAIQAFYTWGGTLTDEKIQSVVECTRVLGRCQKVVYKNKSVFLDVAHNPAAAKFLIPQLNLLRNENPAQGSNFKTLVVFAAMADKDLRAMLGILKPHVDAWYFCGLKDIPRAVKVEELYKLGLELGLRGSAWDTVGAGFTQAVDDSSAHDRVLVLGSFYTIAEVLKVIQTDD